MTSMLSASVAIHSGLRKLVKATGEFASHAAEKAYSAAKRDFELKNQLADDLVGKAAEMKRDADSAYRRTRRGITDLFAKIA